MSRHEAEAIVWRFAIDDSNDYSRHMSDALEVWRAVERGADNPETAERYRRDGVIVHDDSHPAGRVHPRISRIEVGRKPDDRPRGSHIPDEDADVEWHRPLGAEGPVFATGRTIGADGKPIRDIHADIPMAGERPDRRGGSRILALHGFADEVPEMYRELTDVRSSALHEIGHALDPRVDEDMAERLALDSQGRAIENPKSERELGDGYSEEKYKRIPSEQRAIWIETAATILDDWEKSDRSMRPDDFAREWLTKSPLRFGGSKSDATNFRESLAHVPYHEAITTLANLVAVAAQRRARALGEPIRMERRESLHDHFKHNRRQGKQVVDEED